MNIIDLGIGGEERLFLLLDARLDPQNIAMHFILVAL